MNDFIASVPRRSPWLAFGTALYAGIAVGERSAGTREKPSRRYRFVAGIGAVAARTAVRSIVRAIVGSGARTLMDDLDNPIDRRSS